MFTFVKRIWAYLWRTEFVGMSFAMGTSVLLLFVAILASCAPAIESKPNYMGTPVIVKVSDGREYDCVRVSMGNGQGFIDCKEIKK